MTTYASLRWRLMALIAGGSVVTAVIASAGFSWLDLNRSMQHRHDEIQAVGNVVSEQVGPAITLADQRAAGEVLASLRSDRLIEEAVLYGAAGHCFAVYRRTSLGGCPAEQPAGNFQAADGIVVLLPVTVASERCGTLLLRASVPSVSVLLWQNSSGAILIFGLSLVVAAALGVVLQSRVSSPILDIASVAQRIARTHQFQDRVSVASRDELGVLAESFNTMLGEIQRRDGELAQQRLSLEEQIAERSRVNAELRVAKERAESAARLKSEFLANMSHEIRTPLNGVIGMISLVLSRSMEAEDREQLGVAQSAAQSLVTLLNDILDLSKIEAGKMHLEAIDFNLSVTVRDALRIFDSTLRQKELDLRLTFAPGCPEWVRGDPARLRQVLVNLIGNALKFTDKGFVEVTLEPAGPGTLRFGVRDSGIGIPADKLADIFEAFTQADGSHTRRFGGTGLGLTITRRLVNLMGGRLWATSTLGLGSLFAFDLPVLEGAPPAPVADEPANAEAPIRPLNVLVAEDNPVNQKVIRAMLGRQGWHVTLASNGHEAFQLFCDGRFDLILMDVQMPEIDGLRATRLIREEEQRRAARERVPILALTAHASVSQHEQCLSEGMDGVLTKPITMPDLLREIRATVQPALG